MTYNHRGVGPFFLSRAGYDRAMAYLSSSEDKPSDRGLRPKTTILALTRAAFLCRRLARLLRHRWALWPAAVRPGCLTLFSTQIERRRVTCNTAGSNRQISWKKLVVPCRLAFPEAHRALCSCWLIAAQRTSPSRVY